jgi:hypothetical protein
VLDPDSQLSTTPHFGVSLRKLPGAANAVVATGHTDRLRRWALSGVPQHCAFSALTRRYHGLRLLPASLTTPPIPDIARKLIIKTGKNAGKHPSVASLYQALAQTDTQHTADHH